MIILSGQPAIMNIGVKETFLKGLSVPSCMNALSVGTQIIVLIINFEILVREAFDHVFSYPTQGVAFAALDIIIALVGQRIGLYG